MSVNASFATWEPMGRGCSVARTGMAATTAVAASSRRIDVDRVELGMTQGQGGFRSLLRFGFAGRKAAAFPAVTALRDAWFGSEPCSASLWP